MLIDGQQRQQCNGLFSSVHWLRSTPAQVSSPLGASKSHALSLNISGLSQQEWVPFSTTTTTTNLDQYASNVTDQLFNLFDPFLQNDNNERTASLGRHYGQIMHVNLHYACYK